LSGLIRTLAVALIKIANDIRLLGSGPRCGIGELILPANEPGSSIMPGKVNPTQAEMLVQVCMRVLGNDHAVAIGGFFGGQFDLNTAKPLITYSVLESIRLLHNAMLSFNERCIKGIVPNKERISFLVEQSLMLATALNPYIGYDNAARIAKKAFKEGKTIREVALEEKVLSPEELDAALDLRRMVFQDK
jgi:fumarate hydratase class II